MSAALLDAEWWKAAPVLCSGLVDRFRQSAPAACFKVGDYYLQIVANCEPLLDEFDSAYGDCGVAAIPATANRIRCVAAMVPGTSLLLLSFEGPGLCDPMKIIQRLFSLLRHRQCYVEQTGPLPDWRLLVNTQRGNRLLAAGRGMTLLVDSEEAPPEFVTDCIMGMVQAAQPGVLFFHAASVGVGGLCALLIGSGHRGKSTTVLAMARRGHAFLGDDITAVRLATDEVLPFPKSAGLRDGSFARQIQDRVQSCRHRDATGIDGIPRKLVRVSDLFPESRSGPLPLRAAFFLDGFSDHPSIVEFEPQLRDMGRLRSVVSESTPFWGASPGRDLMRFLSVMNLLRRLRCYAVELGTPEASAVAIEEAMAACI